MAETAKTPTNFLERVLNFVQGGDSGKIKRFQKNTTKYCQRQISQRNDEISELNDRIEDANEAYEESKINIDIPSIATTDGAKLYTEDYVNGLMEGKLTIEGMQDEIEGLKVEIKIFNDIISGLK